MLQKSQRLRKKEDFDRVFRNGKAIFFEEIACRFLTRPQGDFRLGFSLSKKHLLLAVNRNRFRRVLSALIADSRNRLPEAIDVVISLRRKPKVMTKKAYEPLIARLLEDIGKR